MFLSFRKRSIKSPGGGGLVNFGPFRGGLLERGAYSQNQSTGTYMIAFQFFYPIFCKLNIKFNDSNT